MTRAMQVSGRRKFGALAALAAVCRRLGLWLGSRARGALLAYAVLELINFWCFRLRLQRLRQPRLGYRRATLADLRWLLRSVEHTVCPVRLSKASLQTFFDDRSGDRREALSWEHYYVMSQEALCILGPSPEEHTLLREIACKLAEREGLQGPHPRAGPPSCASPLAYGQSPVQVVHKPLPIEFLLSSVRWAGDAAFWALGYRGAWTPTSEGWIRYWLATPRDVDKSELPAIFLHGVGMGAVPYLPFLERLRHGRRAPLLVVELPNCSRCSFQDAMPSPHSFRDALERILRKEFGITEAGRYMLVGHSLGTDYCSMVMNDPRLAHTDPPVRPARLVLLDPVCFLMELAAAHRLPFWSLREAFAKFGKRWWKFPFVLPVFLFVIRDEYNQEATKRALVPGTDTIFRCSPTLLKRCPTLVCLSGEDEALPAWKVYDYIRAQMPDIAVKVHPTLGHGDFVVARQWLARSHAEDVLKFLARSKVQKDMSRVASLVGPNGVDSSCGEQLPIARKISSSASDLLRSAMA